jgi:hypothetical protein
MSWECAALRRILFLRLRNTAVPQAVLDGIFTCSILELTSREGAVRQQAKAYCAGQRLPSAK